MKKDKKAKKRPAGPQAAAGDKKYDFKVNYLLAALCAVAAVLLYINTVGHDYVLDDSAAITDNLYVQQGFAGIPKLLTIDFWHFSAMRLGYYRPLPLITYAVEWQLFGRNPHINHITNVLLYGITAFSLFAFLSMLFSEKKYWYPFAIALLFIAHPIHTEVVANIKSRDEIMSLLNIILMMAFHLLYMKKGKSWYAVLSLLFCYLALLSKETAIAGILLIPVALYYKGESISDALKKSALFLVPVLLFYLQKKALFETAVPVIPIDIVNYPYLAPEVRSSSAFMLFLFFIRMLVFPHPLRYDYSYNQLPAVQWDSLWAIGGLLVFLALAVAAVAAILKRRPVGLALAFFFVTIVPALGFILLRGGIFAERFLYAPSLGLCIAAVVGLEAALGLNLKQSLAWTKEASVKLVTAAVIVSAVFVLYSAKTVSRNRAWQNAFILYSTDKETASNNVHNLLHYGTSWLRKVTDEKDKAVKLRYLATGMAPLREALVIHPQFTDAFYWLGYAYELKATCENVQQNADTAIYYLNEAVKRTSDSFMSYYHLGNIYEWFGRYDISSYYYNRSHAINPEYPIVNAKIEEMARKHGQNVHINPLTGKP